MSSKGVVLTVKDGQARSVRIVHHEAHPSNLGVVLVAGCVEPLLFPYSGYEVGSDFSFCDVLDAKSMWQEFLALPNGDISSVFSEGVDFVLPAQNEIRDFDYLNDKNLPMPLADWKVWLAHGEYFLSKGFSYVYVFDYDNFEKSGFDLRKDGKLCHYLFWSVIFRDKDNRSVQLPLSLVLAQYLGIPVKGSVELEKMITEREFNKWLEDNKAERQKILKECFSIRKAEFEKLKLEAQKELQSDDKRTYRNAWYKSAIYNGEIDCREFVKQTTGRFVSFTESDREF